MRNSISGLELGPWGGPAWTNLIKVRSLTMKITQRRKTMSYQSPHLAVHGEGGRGVRSGFTDHPSTSIRSTKTREVMTTKTKGCLAHLRIQGGLLKV